MKKYFLLSMMMLMMMTMSFTSCGDDDKVITTPVSLSIDMPLDTAVIPSTALNCPTINKSAIP